MRQLKCACFSAWEKETKNAICSLNSVCLPCTFFHVTKRYESSAWFVAVDVVFSFFSKKIRKMQKKTQHYVNVSAIITFCIHLIFKVEKRSGRKWEKQKNHDGQLQLRDGGKKELEVCKTSIPLFCTIWIFDYAWTRLIRLPFSQKYGRERESKKK